MALCECGCGEPAPFAAQTQNGYRKGEPQRFIRGHSTPRRIVLQSGQRFGKGVITDPDIRVRQGRRDQRGARLRCDCGNVYEAWVGNLVSGNTKSCGCLKLGNGFNRHPLRGTWYAMIYRCENPAQAGYKHYGGRGITVCERWHDFEVFTADIARLLGPRPAGHTLDRIDNDGNYEPGNVRWADDITQARNRPGHRKLSGEAAAACLARWQAGESISALAREHGVHNSVMNRRLHRLQDRGVSPSW